MAPGKSFIQHFSKAFAVAVLLAFMAIFTGCGDETQSTPVSTNAVIQPLKINHPGPNSIEVLDGRNDVISSNEHELTSAPQFMDINWVDIAKEGDKLKFTMELNAVLPEKAETGKAAEWGFLLDTNQDGAPDWGVYASMDTKNGWFYALNNMKTNEKQALEVFPGTFAQGGTTIIWTLNPTAPAIADSFKWMSFANYFSKSSTGEAVNAADTVPDMAALDKSDAWPLFP